MSAVLHRHASTRHVFGRPARQKRTRYCEKHGELMHFIACDTCDGTGWQFAEDSGDYDMDPLWYDPLDHVSCVDCDGQRRFWGCDVCWIEWDDGFGL